MTLKRRGLGRGLEALLIDVPAKDDRKDATGPVTRVQEVCPPGHKEQLPVAIVAEKQQVPVIIKEINDQAVIAAALIKNIQRENNHLLEEAESLISLLDEFELMVRRFETD